MSQKKTRSLEVDRHIFSARLQEDAECLRNNDLRSEYDTTNINKPNKKLSANNAAPDNDNCHNLVTSEDQDSKKTSSHEKFPIGSPQDKHLNIFSFSNLSYLHSLAGQMHSKIGQWASCPKEFIQSAEPIDVMQHTMMSQLKKLWNPVLFNPTCSVAKHVAIVNHRLSPVELLTTSVRNFWFDNMKLKIGENFIHVDRHLFRYYMEFSHKCTENCLELPSHKVNMILMVKLYNWIIGDDNELRLGKRILMMYNMTKFLKVRYLLDHYWIMFSLRGKKRICEEEAIQAYQLFRQMLSGDLMPIFLSRISKCFLPFVASVEFVILNIHELIYVLQLDILCVNSEDEVFFAVIRWLEYNWNERQKHIDKLMAALRFQYLSPWLQYSIEYHPENHIIGQVGENQMVKAKLWQACLFGEAVLAYDQCPSSINDILVKRYSLIMEVKRKWSCCERVPHHHDTNCPQFRQLTYGSFNRFLKDLHCSAHNFMESLKGIPYKHRNSYICCHRILSKKSTNSCQRNVTPFIYRFKSLIKSN